MQLLLYYFKTMLSHNHMLKLNSQQDTKPCPMRPLCTKGTIVLHNKSQIGAHSGWDGLKFRNQHKQVNGRVISTNTDNRLKETPRAVVFTGAEAKKKKQKKLFWPLCTVTNNTSADHLFTLQNFAQSNTEHIKLYTEWVSQWHTLKYHGSVKEIYLCCIILDPDPTVLVLLL